MQRRNFFGSSLSAGLMQGTAEPQIDREYQSGGTGGVAYQVPVTIERKTAGKPHTGKVFAAIQPHCDDIPIFAGGLVLKLIDEGYTGYLITLSNDSMAGTGPTIGDIVLKNEQDTYEVGRRLKCKESIFLNYPNHNMDAWPIVEIRSRLIFLFRVLKVDTVIVYDPSSLYERNPDHYTTAKAVESAFWMASSRWDYPEHFKAGLTPHGPKDAYYFARGPQVVNRVVDIADYMDAKVHANLANVTQGPAGRNGAMLKARLASQGKRLLLLGNDDETANRQYAKYFALSRDRVRGKQHGLRYAEVYHYVSRDENPEDEYISQNAVAL